MAHYSKCGSFTQGKGWRRTIGVKVGEGGQLMPCRFWLGMDKSRATATALQIESLWVGLDSPYWTMEAFAMADAVRIGATAKDAPESSPLPLAAKPLGKVATVLTVKGLIERYRQAKMEERGLSQPSKHSICCRTKSLERSPLALMPLAMVGAEQLAQIVSHWLARPLTPKGEQISETSARLIVKTARAVFDWSDAVGLWIAPRRFDRIFKLPRTSSQPAITTFSLPDLERLYGRANEEMRLLILLALNCGFCSSELATLKRNEIDWTAKVIKRARQKTAVQMSWKLWDETAIALAKAFAKGMASESDLVLTTGGGKPLVWYSENGPRIDSITPRWTRLMKRANEGLTLTLTQPIVGSFKTLRKTGATMIRAIGGIEVSEMYLAHSEKSMAKFYSTPNQSQLTTALMMFRKQLEPMF